ncbi:hypothetical protein AABB24_020390 [Solanum stoloniferum]|uniref:Integrase catalytic domain-containing protein n=1 Tax=Solanum stoloniferum TaxID=62892 RepID=A0ABD2T7Y0_9SOLN
MCYIYFFKYKSEVKSIFWKLKAKLDNESYCKIKILLSANGKEYTSHQFCLFCEEAGIEHQLTAPYTPEKNGVSERRNRFIILILCLACDLIAMLYLIYRSIDEIKGATRTFLKC